MAQVPSTIWTPWAVISAARGLANTEDQRKVMTEHGRMFYRLALSEVVALLNSTADPSYWGSTVLTVSADQERLSDTTNNSGIITAITSTTITRSTGTFSVGSILIIDYVDIGGGTGLIQKQWIGRITVGGATATYETISGTPATLSAGYGASIQVIKSMSTLSSDISNIKYDTIVAINSSTGGYFIPVSPSEFFSIQRSDFPNKSYSDDIIWTQMGNKIYFNVGSKIVGSVGTPGMYYQRQPNYPSADADYSSDSVYVDLADKWMPLLVNKIYSYCVKQVENDIPVNLANEMQLQMQQIQLYSNSELQNKMAKELAKKNSKD